MIFLACELWVSSFYLVAGHYATGQMGICFATDVVAPAYVVNVDGRGWEPVDKVRCVEGSGNFYLGDGYRFNCYARYKFVYYGIDRTMQLARADNLAVKSDRAAGSRVIKEEIPGYAFDDARYPWTQEPISPGWNSLVDDPALEPPHAPENVRVIQ